MAGDLTGEKAKELEPININVELVKKNVRKSMQDLGACQCDLRAFPTPAPSF